MTSSFMDRATPAQKKAVLHGGHDILVAASAGSGKTRVLVERVMHLLTTKDEHGRYGDLRRMLITTFTNDAAAEMRTRLQADLEERLATMSADPQADPQLVAHLQEQLTAVNVADISTLHAFCLRLLQQYYYAVNPTGEPNATLDPDFRLLADDAEREIMWDDVWEKVRERFYQEALRHLDDEGLPVDELGQSYADVLNLLSGDREQADEALTEVVAALDTAAGATAHPDKWLQTVPRQLYAIPENGTINDTAFCQTVVAPLFTATISRTREWIAPITAGLAALAGVTVEKPTKAVKKIQREVLPAMQAAWADLERQLMAWDDATTPDWDTMMTFVNQIREIPNPLKDLSVRTKLVKDHLDDVLSPVIVAAVNFYRAWGLDDKIPGGKTQVMEVYGNAPAKDRQATADPVGQYLQLSATHLTTLTRRMAAVIDLLTTLTEQFRTAFLREKLRRHVLEFDDLEHYALQLLENDELCASLKQKYTTIMVDEYQDTNGVQEALIQRLATHNVFMVGDNKQSIYRFRQADSHLFQHKYDTFQPAEDGQLPAQTPGELIVLQQNFRSVKNVGQLTNFLFRQLMDDQIGALTYDDQALMDNANPVYQAAGRVVQQTPAEVLLYAEAPASADDAADPDLQGNQGQLVMVAQRIRQMLDQHETIFDRQTKERRPVTVGDIAVLASTRTSGEALTTVFKRFDIPVAVDETTNFFQMTEIKIMLALLQVIDNPHQDIPLVAVLRSPLYGIDENELALIKVNGRQQTDFYTKLTRYAYLVKHDRKQLVDYHPDWEEDLIAKVQQFLDDLTAYRVQAHRGDIATLIWTIYNHSGFLDFVGGMPNGPQRQANLHALYERAQEYEQTSFKGLYQFIRFVHRLEDRQRDLSSQNPQEEADKVHFMTIHKSKGLEFPVVFVIDTDRKFRLGERDPFIINKDIGMGLRLAVDGGAEPELAGLAVNDDDTEAGRENEHLIVRFALPQMHYLQQQEKLQLLAEEMRKLYVAVTRAEQKVIITGRLRSKPEKVTQDLAERLAVASQTSAEVLPYERRATAKSYLDWLLLCLGRMPNGTSQITVHQVKDGEMTTTTGLPGWEQTTVPPFFATHAPQLKMTVWDQPSLAQAIAPQNQGTTAYQHQQHAAEWLRAQDTLAPLPESIQQVLEFTYPNEAATRTAAYQAVTSIKHYFDDPDKAVMPELTVTDRVHHPGRRAPRFNMPRFYQGPTEQKEAPLSAQTLGTATHLVFQNVPLEQPVTPQVVEQTCARLVAQRQLTKRVVAALDVEGIVAFYQTAIGKQLRQYAAVAQREAPFAMLYPANQLFNDSTLPDQPVLIHGIIDGYIPTKEGIVLFDYKTDQLATKPGGLEQLATEYQGQLNLYAQALTLMTGQPVITKALYAVGARQSVTIK